MCQLLRIGRTGEVGRPKWMRRYTYVMCSGLYKQLFGVMSAKFDSRGFCLKGGIVFASSFFGFECVKRGGLFFNSS